MFGDAFFLTQRNRGHGGTQRNWMICFSLLCVSPCPLFLCVKKGTSKARYIGLATNRATQVPHARLHTHTTPSALPLANVFPDGATASDCTTSQ